MTTSATSPQVSQHRTRWKWSLALGGLLLVLGIAGMTVASLLELTSMIVFAPLLLMSSIIQLLRAFFAEKGKESLLHFAAAGLEAALGFLIIMNPAQTIRGLIVVVAIFLLVIGLVRLARSLATQSPGRAWTVMTGVVAILLGISLWIGWPVAKLWFVGLCIAVDFICHGVAWSGLALVERKPIELRVP